MDKKPLILVVDDEPKNIRLISAILEKVDTNVSVALDAFRARKILDTILPDLILLDVMMPGKSGFELCEELKEDKRLREIPIIFLTAKAGIEDTKRGFELGAVDYVVKPFRQEELLARLKIHLALHQTKHELRQQLEEKNEIVGMVAHDLNNPIFAVKAFTEMLQEDLKGDKEKLEIVEQIFKATEHMQSIIKRILSLEELGHEHDKIEKELYDLGLILEGIIDLNIPHANEKNIRFDTHITDVCLVQVDGFRIKEILDNLISNAVKYSKHNSVVVIKLGEDGEGFVRFVIEDKGPGFTDEDRKKIFQKFQKLSARPTGGEHSSGLGLYIVKKLITDMGGSIEMESPIIEKEGARFTVRIPAASDGE